MENSQTANNFAVMSADDKLYDLSMLEEMDDHEYLLEMITILFSDTPKDLKEMKDALLARKLDIVCEKAHKLKGSAGVIQADKLIALLKHIEILGKKGIIDSELSALVEKAMQLYDCIEKALKIYIKRLDN
jgi:HPt (histidine-containing phosphotransfer) domain-containing protein